MKRPYLSYLLPLMLGACLLLAPAAGNNAFAKDDKTDYKAMAETMQKMNISLDTAYVKRYKDLNNYSTLGVQYGVALSTPSFQPVRNTKMVFIPINIGILYTVYCKMFGYMPYFGLQVGAFYTRDAYEFKTSESGYTDNILGAYKATMQVLEVPAVALFHYDFWKMRIMANLGIFGGYRLSIHREYKEGVEERSLENSFSDVENRFDYGLKAGAGFALIFDPIEIHVNAAYKYSWSNLYQPDYLSKYYYRWAYPTNIIISVGVHYQLTRRVGTPAKVLKQIAREEAELMMMELRDKQKAAAQADSLARRDSLMSRGASGLDSLGIRDSIPTPGPVSAAAQADSLAVEPQSPADSLSDDLSATDVVGSAGSRKKGKNKLK